MRMTSPATIRPPRSALVDLEAARRRAREVERRAVRAAFQPPPRMTVTEWADAFRYLSSEASAEPGKYSSARAPWQRAPMDALSDPRVEEVVLMWPSQVCGKTEILLNFIGWRMDMSPGPMLVLQPTLQMAEAWSKDRLAPMLRDTPRLRGKVKDARARDADNTLLHKKYPGGHITAAGANSPAGLASRPIRDNLDDEVDRYPVSAGTEGDPIGLSDRRSATFPDGKKLRISSPTLKGKSRIEAEYEDSTQEKWEVPCPECGAYQILVWGGRDTEHGIKWETGKPDTAHYMCEACHTAIGEEWKGWMNARGRWRVDNPGHPVRGFWMNALPSTFSRWAKLVREFLEVKDDPVRLRQFVNTVLCETWEDEGTQADPNALAARIEAYPTDEKTGEVLVPRHAGILTRSVDVQGDRLETAVWGWGVGQEAWPVDYEMIVGDPGTPEPWKVLDRLIGKAYTHEDGAPMVPACTFIDSGGHHTKEVYEFTRARVGRHVYAIKGASPEGAPLLSRPTRNNSAKAILYMVGSFTAKEAIMSRLTKVMEPGPGYVHLPDWLDSEQLQQLTNEKLITRIVGGRPKRIWVKTGRNEFLDLFAYALAALAQLGPATLAGMAQRVARIQEQGAALKERAAAPERQDAHPPPPRRGGFVDRWRG